jgi:hypothetical protein
MKKIVCYILLMIVIIILLPLLIVKGCSFEQPDTPQEHPLLEEEIKVRVYIAPEEKTVEMELEEYLKGVVTAEMPAEFEPEALKAQAVAARTYIKRTGKVEVVRSASLPAGILDNIELELASKKVGSGDIIIMMTDGILDSFVNDEDSDKSIFEFIEKINNINPQRIADMILDKAYENCGGKPLDDMMVLVAKVWMKAGL